MSLSEVKRIAYIGTPVRLIHIVKSILGDHVAGELRRVLRISGVDACCLPEGVHVLLTQGALYELLNGTDGWSEWTDKTTVQQILDAVGGLEDEYLIIDE